MSIACGYLRQYLGLLHYIDWYDMVSFFLVQFIIWYYYGLIF
jgi:hypothetical protein